MIRREKAIDAFIDAGMDCRDAGVERSELKAYVDALLLTAWPEPAPQPEERRPLRARLASALPWR